MWSGDPAQSIYNDSHCPVHNPFDADSMSTWRIVCTSSSGRRTTSRDVVAGRQSRERHTVDVLIDAFNHWDGSISLTLIVDNNISHRESCPRCHGAISCEHDRAAAIAEASSCRALFPACRCRFLEDRPQLCAYHSGAWPGPRTLF